jgi:hypothetical protein
VDLRAGLDDLEKRKFLTLPGLELQPLGCPAHNYDYAILAPEAKNNKFLKVLKYDCINLQCAFRISKLKLEKVYQTTRYMFMNLHW